MIVRSPSTIRPEAADVTESLACCWVVTALAEGVMTTSPSSCPAGIVSVFEESVRDEAASPVRLSCSVTASVRREVRRTVTLIGEVEVAAMSTEREPSGRRSWILFSPRYLLSGVSFAHEGRSERRSREKSPMAPMLRKR